MKGTFVNAWWIAVDIGHSKAMEFLNNPTPEITQALTKIRVRLKRLQAWASKRWGAEVIGNMIYERETHRTN